MNTEYQILDDEFGGFGVPLGLAETKEDAAWQLLEMFVGGSRDSYTEAEIRHIASQISDPVEFFTHDPVTFAEEGCCNQCEDDDWSCPAGDGPTAGTYFWAESPDFDFDDL